MLIREIRSGGQTGVDRAALDAALEHGLPCGGWCPRGRRAEDGPIPARYPLQETESSRYAERTWLNVRDADGTLILTRGSPEGGTKLTVSYARDAARPCLVLDLAAPGFDRHAALDDVRSWLAAEQIAILNVAGPRETKAPGIHREAADFLRALILL